MKKLYFAIIAVIVLGAGIYITSTPEFAITRLSLAAKEKSLERFEMNADIKAIAHNLVSDSVTQPFSQALGGGGFGSWVSQNLTALVGDQLEASIQEDIKTAIAEGTFLKDHPRADTTMSLAALEERLGFEKFHYVSSDLRKREVADGTAKLTLIFRRDEDATEMPVEVELTRKDGAWSWQLSRINNPGMVIEFLLNHPLVKSTPSYVPASLG